MVCLPSIDGLLGENRRSVSNQRMIRLESMKKISLNQVKTVVKNWRLGDYFRQFSIVATGIIVTFLGSDWITERARQKEVYATMQLVAEELEYNRNELRDMMQSLDMDRYMSSLLREYKMDISEISEDTLKKYEAFFISSDDFYYKTDALDVLKGSSLMQYISDKSLLQDVLQTYFQLERKKKDINDYFQVKRDVLVGLLAAKSKKYTMLEYENYRDYVS